ncbi:MAG TPA: ATP cone domain-containing protein, partial [Nitrososphaerales archaeon]
MVIELIKVKTVTKRDGRTVEFDQEKIVDAIWKATQSVGGKDRNLAKRLSHEVIELINQKFSSKTPSVEDIQDMTEKVLMEQGNSKIAKSYILYRQKRAEIREEKKRILEKNEIDEVDKNLDINALRVLKSRYLRKDGTRTVESAKQLFTRVSTQIGLPDIIFDEKVYAQNGKAPIQQYEEYDFSEFEEKLSIGKYRLNKYHLEALKRLYDRMNNNGCMKMSWSRLMISIKSGDFDTYEKQIDEYYNLMINKKFMPNTPALANFGNPLGMGSACFVMGVEDSIDSIMETLKKAAIIFKAGGGVGYNFSNLRPEGDIVNSTSGLASGPMSFMRMFDMMTDVIKQGGIRRGANMGILNINHPD